MNSSPVVNRSEKQESAVSQGSRFIIGDLFPRKRICLDPMVRRLLAIAASVKGFAEREMRRDPILHSEGVDLLCEFPQGGEMWVVSAHAPRGHRLK